MNKIAKTFLIYYIDSCQAFTRRLNEFFFSYVYFYWLWNYLRQRWWLCSLANYVTLSYDIERHFESCLSTHQSTVSRLDRFASVLNASLGCRNSENVTQKVTLNIQFIKFDRKNSPLVICRENFQYFSTTTLNYQKMMHNRFLLDLIHHEPRSFATNH